LPSDFHSQNSKANTPNPLPNIGNVYFDFAAGLAKQLFKAVLKEYKPTLHPKQILFVADLPEKYSDLLTKAIPDNHRFIFNSTAPKAAMKEMFDSFRLERVPLE